jgi:hypothetical protein
MKVRPLKRIQARFATSNRTWIDGACSVALSVRVTTKKESEKEYEKSERPHGAIGLREERLKSHECVRWVIRLVKERQ